MNHYLHHINITHILFEIELPEKNYDFENFLIDLFVYLPFFYPMDEYLGLILELYVNKFFNIN